MQSLTVLFPDTGNDPLNKTDPTGLRPEDDDDSFRGECIPSKKSWWIGKHGHLAVCERVEIGAFIPDETSHLDPFGQVGLYEGDGRSWVNGAVPRDRSRAVIEIDFEEGMARIQVNPTHGVDGTCWSAWGITVNSFDYGIPGGDQTKNMFSFSTSDGGRAFKVKWSLVHGDRRWFAAAFRIAFDGSLTFKNEGDSQSVSYDGDCFPSIEAYHFGSDGSVVSLAKVRSRAPFWGLAYAPNCKLTSDGSL